MPGLNWQVKLIIKSWTSWFLAWELPVSWTPLHLQCVTTHGERDGWLHGYITVLGSFRQTHHLYSKKCYTQCYTRELGVVYASFNGVHIAMSESSYSSVCDWDHQLILPRQQKRCCGKDVLFPTKQGYHKKPLTWSWDSHIALFILR